MSSLPSYHRKHAPGGQPPFIARVKTLARSRYALLLVLATLAFFVWTRPNSKEYFLSYRISQQVRAQQSKAYALASQKSRVQCDWKPWHAERYAPLLPAAVPATSGTIFLAMNLYNNEDVLPTIFQELPLLLNHLGPERVFVSIYENGSNDRTPELLGILGDLLTALGSPHRIVSKGQAEVPHKEDGHRIVVLAAARNAAMEPLYSGEAAKHVPGGSFDEVLFMNDIAFCVADMLEVIYQKRLQGANQACAVDWGGKVVYDRWIIRTMTGSTFYRYDELVEYFNGPGPADGSPKPVPKVLPLDPDDHNRFLANLPMQVFSCWNGATIIDAAAFLPSNNVRFRIAKNDIGENGKPKNVTEKASECFLSSVDLWKANMGKIMIVPKASITYGQHDYNDYRKDGPMVINPIEERIDWALKPPQKVMHQDYAVWYEPERWGAWDEA